MKLTYFFLLLFFLIYGCSSPIEPPKIDAVTSVYNVKYYNNNLTFDFDIEVTNPNKMELFITSAYIDIYIGDNYISSITLDNEITLKSGKNTISPLSAKIPLIKLKSLIPILYKDNIFKFKGSLNIKKFGMEIPFEIDHQIKFNLKDYLLNFIK